MIILSKCNYSHDIHEILSSLLKHNFRHTTAYIKYIIIDNLCLFISHSSSHIHLKAIKLFFLKLWILNCYSQQELKTFIKLCSLTCVHRTCIMACNSNSFIGKFILLKLEGRSGALIAQFS